MFIPLWGFFSSCKYCLIKLKRIKVFKSSVTWQIDGQTDKLTKNEQLALHMCLHKYTAFPLALIEVHKWHIGLYLNNLVLKFVQVFTGVDQQTCWNFAMVLNQHSKKSMKISISASTAYKSTGFENNKHQIY